MPHSHDVLSTLAQEHREQLDLLHRTARTEDPRVARRLVAGLTARIVRHSLAEEVLVYPTMRALLAPAADRVVEHDLEEHLEIQSRLRQLELTTPLLPRFRELVDQLVRLVRHHSAAEEIQQYPLLREAAPDHVLERMRRDLDRVPPPRVQTSPASPGQVPTAALVDRVREDLLARLDLPAGGVDAPARG